MIFYVLLLALVLVLVFYVMRVQAIRVELIQAKSALKSLQKQTQYSLGSSLLMAQQLQYSYRLKLEDKRRHGVLFGEDLLVTQFLVDNVVFMVVQCCERKATVEESVKKAVAGTPLDLTKIQQFMSRQTVDVRVPWSKNTLEGYLAACNHLLIQNQPGTDKTTADAAPAQLVG